MTCPSCLDKSSPPPLIKEEASLQKEEINGNDLPEIYTTMP